MLQKIKLSSHVAKNVLLKQSPFLFYLKPTARCNLRCKSCNRWQDESSIKDELPLSEIIKILEMFRKAGCVVCTLWGGEPTLRSDLPEILAAAKKLGFRTSMCTNCLLLPKKAGAILPNLDVLLCSLDGYGKTHDAFRGVDGLFEKVTDAIKIASSHKNCYIKIWASLHKKNLHEVDKLAELAKELHAGIEFFPIAVIEGYNNDLVPDRNDRLKVFSRILEFKKQGYPIRNPARALKILRDSKPFTCNFGQIAIFLDHTGNVYTCEDSAGDPQHNWCNYKDFDPDTIFSSREFKQVAKKLKKCNICTLPCMLELSGNLMCRLPELAFQRDRWK
jgi:MoaA/NifB/PqqE/SkfB family radical SAM enzyme